MYLPVIALASPVDAAFRIDPVIFSLKLDTQA
jgi:hypothetical protein